MQIKYKIFSVILLIISLLAFSWGYHIYEDIDDAERYAFTDAESTATVLALSIMHGHEDSSVPPLYKNPQELRHYIGDLHRNSKVDIVVVDTAKKILADVIYGRGREDIAVPL